MPRLNHLVPTNLADEKAKFFAANFQYNPQFTYERITTRAELSKYGRPNWWHLFLAKRILKKHLKEKDLRKQIKEGKIFLNHQQIDHLIKERLDFYHLGHKYQIVYSENFISRIAVNNEENLIKVRLPIAIDRFEIEAILNHEIDTHVLRQFNYENQIWFGKKRKYGFKSYLRTEEGLAATHELITSDHKLAYKSAANYIAVDLALKKDFKTVFEFFYKIWQDPERAWTWTLKKKRGLWDTGKRGAFTKDLVYFEGFIEVLKYLQKSKYNPSELYYGKIDLHDIAKAKKIGINTQIILPKVFTDDKAAYKRAIIQIAKNNLWKLF